MTYQLVVEHLTADADKLPDTVHLRVPVSGWIPDKESRTFKIIGVDKSVVPYGNYRSPYFEVVMSEIRFDPERSRYTADVEILDGRKEA